MDYATILGSILRDMTEAKVDPNRIDANETRRMVNAAYIEACRRTRCLRRAWAQACTDDTATYLIPDDVIAIDPQSVRFDTDIRPLTEVTTDQLPILSTTWRSTVKGTPRYYYRDEGRYLGVYPKPLVPVGSPKSLYLSVRCFPSSVSGGVVLLSAPADKPAMPEPFHPLLVHFPVWQYCTLYASDNPAAAAKAAAAKAEWDRLLEDLGAAAR